MKIIILVTYLVAMAGLLPNKTNNYQDLLGGDIRDTYRVCADGTHAICPTLREMLLGN